MGERPANWQKALANNYIELYKFEQNGDYERALKICNKILHNYPDETTAFHCKVVCFIHMSKFEEALHFMKNNIYANDMHFERAYCLYRCNRSKEALDIINGLVELNDEIKELQAQVLYRLDRFSEAFEIYRELSLKSDDDYKDERDTNLGASLTYSGSDLINNHINEIREDTYELCFNKACVIIALGQYTEAEKKLRQCEKLCRDALEEDGLSEEEIQVELAHIKYGHFVKGMIWLKF